jgi:hypothetical protein
MFNKRICLMNIQLFSNQDNNIKIERKNYISYKFQAIDKLIIS